MQAEAEAEAAELSRVSAERNARAAEGAQVAAEAQARANPPFHPHPHPNRTLIRVGISSPNSHEIGSDPSSNPRPGERAGGGGGAGTSCLSFLPILTPTQA